MRSPYGHTTASARLSCGRPVIAVHFYGWLVDWGLTSHQGYTETGPRFIVPSDGLEKPGIEPATPGLQGEAFLWDMVAFHHWVSIGAH